MMHFRMVNHILGGFFSHQVVKEEVAMLLSFLVVLVFDVTMPM
jgi:hypothetical protein